MIGGLAVIAVAGGDVGSSALFPISLDSYRDAGLIKSGDIFAVLGNRIAHTPFNLFASLIFLFAILHTFAAVKITSIAKNMELTHVEQMRKSGKSEEEIEHNPSVMSEMLHFFGEVEAIFGIWVIVLAAVTISFFDWSTFKNYIAHTVNYTEPMFVVVIMALAATRPVMQLAKLILGKFAAIGKNSPSAWWLSILTLAPILGSFITEPAAMTIAAMLLAEQFYRLKPSSMLAYATIGLLFVNISVGGTFTNFAAPPVLMVKTPWDWTSSFMTLNFGWKAFLGIIIGGLTFKFINPENIKIIIGSICILFIAFKIFNQSNFFFKPTKRKGKFWSLITGYTSCIIHAGGQPISFYLLPLKLDKTTYVGTATLVFLYVNLSSGKIFFKTADEVIDPDPINSYN